MGFVARTLVEAIFGPAALVDGRGRVRVANARWLAADGDGLYSAEGDSLAAAVPGCPAHSALLTAVHTLAPEDPPVLLHCSCGTSGDRTVQVAMLECEPGTYRRLVTTGQPMLRQEPEGTGVVAQAKSDFLALLGHEIRTPVTAVVGMVDLLRAIPLPQDVREVVDGVHRSTHALKALTDDLLDLARLETGQLEVHEREVELRPLLEAVIEPLQQHARQKGILLLAALAPDMPATLLGDPDRLRQVLTSVVGNAMKFTARGEVVLTMARDAQNLLIMVCDTGPGLAEQDRVRIFAPFVQADSSAARRHEGAGLGLAIAARLVQRMGGTIEVQSELGHGSQFHVRLPLKVVPASTIRHAPPSLVGRRIAVVAPSERSTEALVWLLAAAGAHAVPAGLADVIADPPDVDTVLWCDDSHDPEAVHRANAIMDKLGPAYRAIMISTTDPRHGLVRRPSVITSPLVQHRLLASLKQERSGVRGAPIALVPLAPGRVLLAEDNEVNSKVFSRMIELFGVQCDVVGDGASAAAAVLGDQRYDVVLMDVQMPGIDGLEATRRIRAAGVLTPILALTATALSGDRERCRAAGMTGYLTKPITLPELRQALEPYLTPQGPPTVVSAAPPPDVRPSDPVTVDLDRLHNLEDELADRALVVSTVQTFLVLLDGRRVELCDALGRHDWEALRVTAHTLKSSSALLGADALAGVCARIEQSAGNESTQHELAALVAEAERAVVGTAEKMAGYVAGVGPAR